MAKIKAIELSEEQRAALARGWHYGPTHALRQRCQMILLKSQWLTSQEVALQGRGRRPILKAETDLAAVRRAVQENRQRVSLARAELEKELGKGFSTLTLKRFLERTAAASSAFDGR